MKASIATSDLVDWASEQGIPGAEIIFINFGLCGARPDCRRGSLYQVNQIIDSNTRTTHLVGTMPNVTLPTAALTTTPHAQSDHTRLNTELVDMEAAAIWEVLKSKLPNSPALCLKLVTDHCNPKDCNYQSAQTLLKPLLPQLCELAQSLRSYRLTGEL
ncbi:MAG: hypothetical protein PHY48_17080 [Candidatus Cloacimonetes bacterium]|nr:hypothetical protein [Candidatus Cloacimonadota bacterium]